MPVEPGTVEEYVLRLYPFANTFKPGHRLVAELSNSEPLVDEHNALLPPDAFHLPVGRPVTHKIYRDAAQLHRLFAPGTRVQYDNVGYGLLAAVVEWRTSQGFADALRDLVLGPLGVEGYLSAGLPREAASLARSRAGAAHCEASHSRSKSVSEFDFGSSLPHPSSGGESPCASRNTQSILLRSWPWWPR